MQKSRVVALLLVFFLGPIGLLYSSVWGGLIMGALVLICLILSFLTFGVSLALLFPIWIACLVWVLVAPGAHKATITSSQG